MVGHANSKSSSMKFFALRSRAAGVRSLVTLLLGVVSLLSRTSHAQLLTALCSNGDEALNNQQNLNTVPDGAAFDGYMFDLHVKTGTFGIDLMDFGGWATQTNNGASQAQFAPIRVYYTDEGVSFQEAAANESRWNSAWGENQIIGTTTVANQHGAYPVAGNYQSDITISQGNFRGLLITFIGPTGNFQGDADLFNFNINGNAPEVFPEDDHIFIEGGYGYTHPFQSVSNNFYRMAGPICYDIIDFPNTVAPTPIRTANPTPEPIPIATDSPTPVPSPQPTPTPTLVPTPVETPLPTEATPVPTAAPTPDPTGSPTARPTAFPTPVATQVPTLEPTAAPTLPPLIPPTLTSLAFSSTGAAIHFDFDIDTTRNGDAVGATIACESYFLGETLARFGIDPRCTWSSSQRFTVALGSEATIVWRESSLANSEILFNPALAIGSAVIAEAVFDINDADGFFVDFPDDPTPPTAVLDVPSTVGPCTVITLDARQSSGFVGRIATEQSYTYRSSCAVLPQVSGDPQALPLVDEIQTSSPQWLLPENTLAGGETCEFSVQVRSFLELDSAVDAQDVTQSEVSITSAIVRGPSNGQWMRNRPLQLFLDVGFDSCATSEAPPDLAFVWTARDLINDEEIVLTENLQADLVVPSFVLTVGYEYEFTVVATPEGRPDAVPAVANEVITIVRSPIEAQITGASTRTWSRFVDLTLDAEDGSFDPDYPIDLGFGGLTYEWICRRVQDSQPCGLSAEVTMDQPQLMIPSRLLPVAPSVNIADSFRFSVRATAFDGTFETAEAVVNIVEDPIPLVEIRGALLIDLGETLRLEGTVQNAQEGEQFDFLWQETSGEGEPIDFNSVFVETSQSARNLVIEPGLLEPLVTYNFVLTAFSRTTSLVGEASVEVRIHFGPTITAFGITPSLQQENLHHLEVSAFSEFDGAEPFQYRFSYEFLNSEVIQGAGGEVVIVGFNFASFTDVYLLPGQYIVRVQVRDSFGAVSEETQNAEIPDPNAGGCDLEPVILALDTAVAQQQVASALQLTTVLAESLFQSRYDICRPPELRETLFRLLHDLYLQNLVLPVHATQLASALLWLTDPQLPLPEELAAIAVELTEVLLLKANGFVDDGNLPEAAQITSHVGPVLSNLIASDISQCPIITQIQSQLESLFELELGPLLAGESPDILTATSVAGGAVRSDVSEEGVTLSGGSDTLAFSAQIQVDANSGVVSLVIVTLDSSINTCFEDSDGTAPAGPVVIIDTDQNVTSVTFRLSFDEFIVNTACGQEDQFECGFVNETTSRWDTRGCEVLDQNNFASGGGELLCSCTHLTTFAVLKNFRLTKENCEQFGTAPIFAFISLYVLVASYATWQGHQLFVIAGSRTTVTKGSNIRMAAYSDVLVIMLCLAQIVWLILFFFKASEVAVSVFLSLGRVMMYWIFSITIYQWAAIAFTQLSRSRDQVRRTKVLVSIGVGMVTSVLIAMAIGFASAPIGSDAYQTIEQAGTFILACFNIITMLAFLIIGHLLIKRITAASSKAGLKSKSTTEAARRIYKITITFCVVFTLQTFITIYSGASDSFQANFLIWQSAYLVLDLLALCIVMFIFRSMITAHQKMSTKSKSQLSPSAQKNRSNATKYTNGYSVQSQNSSRADMSVTGMTKSEWVPSTTHNNNAPAGKIIDGVQLGKKRSTTYDSSFASQPSVTTFSSDPEPSAFAQPFVEPEPAPSPAPPPKKYIPQTTDPNLSVAMGPAGKLISGMRFGKNTRGLHFEMASAFNKTGNGGGGGSEDSDSASEENSTVTSTSQKSLLSSNNSTYHSQTELVARRNGPRRPGSGGSGGSSGPVSPGRDSLRRNERPAPQRPAGARAPAPRFIKHHSTPSNASTISTASVASASSHASHHSLASQRSFQSILSAGSHQSLPSPRGPARPNMRGGPLANRSPPSNGPMANRGPPPNGPMANRGPPPNGRGGGPPPGARGRGGGPASPVGGRRRPPPRRGGPGAHPTATSQSHLSTEFTDSEEDRVTHV